MSFNAYTGGGGGTTGDEVAVNAPIYIGGTGHIWYVYSVTGVDSGARGKERERPLATLTQAVTNAAAGDIIIFLSGHAETIAVPLTVNKALTIVSEGSGSSRARLTCGVGAAVMITLSQTGTSLNNIYFPASTTVGGTRVSPTAAGVVMDNCYFECGANDTASAVVYGAAANSCQLTNAYFLATGSQPACGVLFNNTNSGFFMEDCTFDGGSFGFSDFAFKATAVLTAIYVNKISQLNNADVSLVNGWTGLWIPDVISQSARFEG